MKFFNRFERTPKQEKALAEKEKSKRIKRNLTIGASFAAAAAVLQIGGPKIEALNSVVEKLNQEAEALNLGQELEKTYQNTPGVKEVKHMNYSEFKIEIDKTEDIDKLINIWVVSRGKYFFIGDEDGFAAPLESNVLWKIINKVEENPSMAGNVLQKMLNKGLESSSYVAERLMDLVEK